MIKLAIAALALAGASCSSHSNDNANGSAKPVNAAATGSANRSTGPFHAIDNGGALDVDVQVGPALHVEIVADPDVIAKITTEVRAGTLVIGEDNVRTSNRVQVKISTPELDAVTLRGSGAIKVAGISGPKFSATVSGTGSVDLDGTTDAVAFEIKGTGNIRGKTLAAKSATVSTIGTGNVELTATEQLGATVTGVGHVLVYGHPPSVTKSVTGVGSIELR